jgi:HTH-type transcriptional regulator/antitoxin HigA
LATRTPKAGRPRATDRYLALVARFPLRPLRTDDELAEATALVESLLGRDDLDPDELGYLDVLAALVERYQDEHHPVPPASDADLLRHLIESRATTQARVAAATGIAAPTLSDVLAGRRRLNRRHIAALARFFRVSPALFVAVGGDGHAR